MYVEKKYIPFDSFLKGGKVVSMLLPTTPAGVLTLA